MYRRVKNIIPREYGSRFWLLALNLMSRAVLNFFSIALMVPLLVLIVDGGMISRNKWLAYFQEWSGCETDRDFALLVISAIIVLILLKNVICLILYKYERDFIYDLYRTLSRRLYIDYFRRGLRFVWQNNSSKLSRRVNLITFNFVVGVLRPMVVMAGEVMLLALILIALALYNVWAVGVVVLIFVPSLCAYYYFVRRRMTRYGRQENEAHKVRFRSVAECFRGYADVEVNNAFDQMLRLYDKHTDKLIQVQKRDAMLSAMPQSFMEMVVTLGMALLVVVGLYLPDVNVGIVFGIFAVATIRLVPSVRTILSAYTSIRHNNYTLDILSDISDSEPMSCDDSVRISLRDKIELRDLSFAYQDDPIFQSFNLVIKRGEKVGVQGASGRGKSTLINLLLGLVAPSSGQILIDGRLLDSYSRRSWQNSIGYVAQNQFLLDGSLKENIAFGVAPEKIDMERLHSVISMASLDEFVKSLPDGIESNIGESGCRVSGGERQRIGIARALYRQPDILILDEATSALDLDTEEQINSSIKQLSFANPDLTIIVVAHRASALDYCDYVVNL
ncbi:MAG: ABC transporter ATP-binding protein [Alistipes sp.]|nr:ABC transporter ATP-binding protein [Alistipes sp.]